MLELNCLGTIGNHLYSPDMHKDNIACERLDFVNRRKTVPLLVFTIKEHQIKICSSALYIENMHSIQCYLYTCLPNGWRQQHFKLLNATVAIGNPPKRTIAPTNDIFATQGYNSQLSCDSPWLNFIAKMGSKAETDQGVLCGSREPYTFASKDGETKAFLNNS